MNFYGYSGGGWRPLLLSLAIVAILLGTVLLVRRPDDCPREIVGYKCRGRGCNHDPELVEDARKAMEEL